MEYLLHEIAHYVALAIEGIAIAIIAFGALEAVVGIVRAGLNSATTNDDRRAVWLNAWTTASWTGVTGHLFDASGALACSKPLHLRRLLNQARAP